MRTIISGVVTPEHLEDADIMADIVPTSFVTNGRSTPPACGLPVHAIPVCPMQPVETSTRARDYTLVQNADALICVGSNPHLVELARSYDLPVYEVDE